MAVGFQEEGVMNAVVHVFPGANACRHEHIVGWDRDQTLQCEDCGYVFPEVPDA